MDYTEAEKIEKFFNEAKSSKSLIIEFQEYFYAYNSVEEIVEDIKSLLSENSIDFKINTDIGMYGETRIVSPYILWDYEEEEMTLAFPLQYLEVYASKNVIRYELTE